MEFERAQASLQAAELCLAHGLVDSAVNRAYFALFQAAICALERRGMRRREWTHKGVHSDFAQLFVRRRTKSCAKSLWTPLWVHSRRRIPRRSKAQMAA